jgi:hypothetical protein
MKRLLHLLGTILVIVLIPAWSLAVTYTWNGSVSSAWNVNANWTPATGFPVSGDIVNLTSGSAPNPCILNSDRTIMTLNISAGMLNLNGFTLTLTSAFSSTGGTVQDGILSAVNITAMSATTFNGPLVIRKTGGGDNTLGGGNTFNGSVTLSNSDNNFWLMANVLGDTFNGPLVVIVTNTGRIHLSHNGNSTFADNITINCDNTGGVEFGGGSGTSVQTAGALLTAGFTVGALRIFRFTQNSTATNGAFNPSSFLASNSTFNGPFSITTTSGDVSISGCAFTAGNQFISAANLQLANTCAFSSVSGATLFTKNGGVDNNWNGTFTFGNWGLTNNDDNHIAVGNSTASVLNVSGASVVNVNSTGRIYLAHMGAASFGGSVTLNCSASGGVEIGGNSGISSLTGGGLLTNGFAGGSLIVNRLTQTSAAANGSFNPTSFSCLETNLSGDIAVATSSEAITISNSSFTAGANFSAAGDLNISGTCNFSTASGNAVFVKNGGGDNNWNGTMAFGPVSVTNNDNNHLALANSGISLFAFLGTSSFTNTSTGRFYISHQGASSYADDITFNNSGSGGMEVGGSGGTSVLSLGSLLTNGFVNGSLVLKNLTQVQSDANGSFNPTSFSAVATSFKGAFAVYTGTGNITLTDFSATAMATFESAGGISITGPCHFSTMSGSATFVKNGGNDDNWVGNLSFGPVSVTNNDNNYLALGNSAGSVFTFNGPSSFTNTFTGRFYLSHQGSSSFAGDITIANLGTGGMEIGGGSGVSVQSAGSLLSGGFVNGSLVINNFTQSVPSVNGSVNPTTFSSVATILRGPFAVVTSQGNIELTNVTVTGGCTFDAAGGLTMSGTCNYSTVSGSAVFVKNGGNDDSWNGTFTFGPVSVTNNDNNFLSLANSAASSLVFSGISSFTNTSTGRFYLSHQGSSSFAGDITIANLGTGGMEIGGGSGISTQSTGSLQSGGFSNGSFVLNNLTQVLPSSNGSFTPTTFSSSGTTLRGAFSVATSVGNITLTNCSVLGSASFLAATGISISGTCNFSTVSGSAVFVKNSGGDNNWNGTMAFGPVSVTNNDTNYLALANSAGSVFTFNGPSSFTNTAAGRFYLSHQGSSSFAGDITLTNLGTGGMEVGGGSGISTQTTGSLLTGGFAGGSFVLNNLTQALPSSNGSFTPTSFTASGTTLRGAFSVETTAGSVTITNAAVLGSATFISASGISISGTCNFSTVSGNAVFVKNGGGDNSWNGNLTFGPVSVTNNDDNFLNISNAAGSVITYTGSSVFINAANGRLYVSHQGTSSFSGDVTFNNTATGGIEVGGGGGTSAQSTGRVLTEGFTSGSFVFNRFTQSGTEANGSFTPTSFSALNTIIRGDFSVVTTAGDLTINTCSFTAGNTFTSAGNLMVTNANSFSTISGTTTFEKNGGGDNIWTGGNTFGNVTVINNDNNYVLMANSSPDDYNGSATFMQMSTGLLYPAHNGNNTFSGNISTTGSAAAITFCQGSGRMVIDGPGNRTFSGASGVVNAVRRMTMATAAGGSLALTSPLNVSIDLTMISGGLLTSSSAILTLTDEGTTVNSGNAGSFVDGPMQYTFSTNSSSRSTLNFPAGTDSDWRPVTLQVAHTTNTAYIYRAEVFQASATALGYALPATVDTVSGVHYWDIDRFLASTMVSSPSADLRTSASDRPIVTLSFGTNDGVYSGPNLTIVKNTVASPTTWFDIGGVSTAGTSTTPVSGTVTSTSTPTLFNSFSRFTLGSRLSGLNPLPVELVSFSGECLNEKVSLSWSTASEINNDYFTVERSADGVDFAPVGEVDGAGNSYQLLRYFFEDAQPQESGYYRLKQTDFDGAYEYSDLVFVACAETEGRKLLVYPNPGTSAFTLMVSGGDEIPHYFSVTDLQGQRVNEGTVQRLQIISTEDLAPGMYFITLDTGDRVRWIKQD